MPHQLTNRDFPKFNSSLSKSQEIFALTFVLLGGLIVAAPLFEFVVTAVGLPLPQPLLIGVGAVWVGYGLLLLALRRLSEGLFVGFLVASTFSADVPLTSTANLFPGHTVGTAVMYYGPLAGLVGLAALYRWNTAELPLAVYTLGAFVGATVLSALFGGGPSTGVALWFSLFALAGFFAYFMTILAIRETAVSFADALRVFCIVVGAQALVGMVQFLRGAPFGLWELGEANRHVVETLSLPIVGSLPLGTHVSGFTGMAFQLAFLLVLIAPLAIVLYLRVGGWRQVLSLGILLLIVLLVRGSSSDAARGAFLGALVAFTILSLAVWVSEMSSSETSPSSLLSNIGAKFAAGCSMVALLLYPSSAAGDVSSQPVDQPTPTDPQEPTPPSDTETPSAGGSGGGDPELQSSWLVEQVETINSLSIPLFDLSNLGTRLVQYIAAIDVFLQYPLVGLGGMNFVLVGQQYGVTSPPYTELTYPIHSIYFTLLAETGLLGFSLFVLTVGLIFFYGYQAAQMQTTNSDIPLALLAGMSGALAYMLLDVFLLTNAASWAQFWIVGGLVTISYQQASR